MSSRALSLSLLSALVAVPLVTSCSGTPLDETGDVGLGGTGVSGASTTGGAATGGASGAATGGASGAATSGASGTTTTGGATTGGAPTGGAAGAAVTGGTGGAAGSGVGGTGTGGTGQGGAAGGNGGSGVGGNFMPGGMGGMPTVPPLDCGAEGWAVENHGPPANRVNYVILADGYTSTTVNTTLVTHINAYMQRRFEHESGKPYLRYRNFVNICVMKAISQSDGIGNGATAFDGGNGGDRLAAVNEQKVNTYIQQKVPASFVVNWKAVVLNQNLWENTGAALMLWSGGNTDGPGAALHEGGHGFHQLADEYGSCTGGSCGSNTMGTGTSGTIYAEVNSAGNPATTDGKWDMWIGTTQTGATGLQGTWSGSRYVGSGQYRPSANSMMNSLFCNGVCDTSAGDLSTSFNAVSREQIIFTIWRAVTPIDSTEPPSGTTAAPAAADNPSALRVNVVDPAVINVDWTIDGATTMNGGTSFSTAALSPGAHMITAKAYDNATTDMVKYRSGTCPSSVTGRYCSRTAWPRSTQTVAWNVTKR